MSAPKLYHFEEMPFEKMTDLISRRYIVGKNGMICYFFLKKGAIVPDHNHVSEQISYIIKGAVKVISAGNEYIVKAGDVLVIPPNEIHRFEALEDTIDIDIFSPPREDWLKGDDSYLKKGK